MSLKFVILRMEKKVVENTKLNSKLINPKNTKNNFAFFLNYLFRALKLTSLKFDLKKFRWELILIGRIIF